MAPDPAKLDRTALALLWLTAFRQKEGFPRRVWKAYVWDVRVRLHEAGSTCHPKFTSSGEGAARAVIKEMIGSGPAK